MVAEIRPPTQEDIDFLAPRLRQADLDELLASGVGSAQEALRRGLAGSRMCRTVSMGGEVVGMFGVTPGLLSSEVWALVSSAVEKQPVAFTKISRKLASMLLEHHPLLTNYVDARHAQSIRWLRALGAELGYPQPRGPLGLPFHRFEISRR